jgi:hypothetical protein
MRGRARKGFPLRRAPLACLALALAASLAPGTAAAAVDTWPATPGDKVFPATTRPAGAAAGPVISAARDEYEGAQVAIRSDAALTITPSASDLTGPGTIPASAIQLLRVGYVTLQRVSTGVDALEGDGRYPDPLFPITGPITVPAGETTSVYTLVHVPADAPAGHYDGTLDLGAAGVVPLAVEVAPVTANRDGYTIVARLNQIQLAKASGVSEDDPRFVTGVYTRLLPMLRAHGVSPGKPPHTAPKVDPGTWALDYSDSPFGTARRTNLNAFFAMGFPAVEVPFLPNFPQSGGEDRAFSQEGKRRTAARDFAAAFAPVAGTTFALPVDEPNAKTYAQLNRAAAQLASASPHIPVLATEAPHPEALKAIGRSVDIWAPPIWDLFKVPKGVASVRAKGKRVWWYTYGSDTQRYTPNVLIDKPTTEPRVMGWLAAKEGVEGFYYWGLNNWGGDDYHSPFADPWYLSHTRAADTCGRGGDVGGNGEASLIYPTGDPSDPAIGSLRLESLRDGAEDNSLLRTLQATDPAFYAQIMDGVSTPYTGRSEGGRSTGCNDDGRPAYLPVVETDPAAVDGARRAVLARLSATPLPTLQGTVVFGAAPASRSRGRRYHSLGLGGSPVEGAVVRFGAFSTVTDAKGRWTLANVSPAPGTLVVSRDPFGKIDPVAVPIDAATLAQPGAIRVATPPMPLWPSDPVIRPGGLTLFSGRIAPARARTRGQSVTMTLGRRYHSNGDEVVYPGNVSPSVDATYPTGKGAGASKALRDWSGYRFLEFTAEVLKRPPADRAFHLIVTPGGHWLNATKVAVGNRTQLVRLSLAGMRGMSNVRYLRFGIQSAVPKPWRGDHDLAVTLRVANMRLVP